MGILDLFKPKLRESLNEELAKLSLEDLLIKASENKKYQGAFYSKLWNDQVFVLARPEQTLAPGEYLPEEEMKVEFFQLPTGHLAIFTSEARILDGGVIKEQVPFIAMKGEGMLRAIQGKPALLNPFSDYGKEFTVEEIDALLEAFSQRTIVPTSVRGGSQKIVDFPAIEDDEFLDAMRSCFRRLPNVEAAFLSVVEDTRSGLVRKVIGLKIDGTLPPILQEVSKVLHEVAKPKEIVDVVDLDDRGTKSFFKKGQPPFYKRSY